MTNATENRSRAAKTAPSIMSKKQRHCIAYVGGNMFLGNRYARDPELLQTLKITHVVAIASGLAVLQYNDDFVSAATSLGIKVMTLTAEDTDKEDMLAIYKRDELRGFLDEGTSGNNKTLAHCFAGRSRSATLIALHLIGSRGLTVSESLLLLLSARLELELRDSFIQNMKDLECQKDKKVASSFKASNLPGSSNNNTTEEGQDPLAANRVFFKEEKNLACVKKLRETKEPEPDETKLDVYKLNRFQNYEPFSLGA